MIAVGSFRVTVCFWRWAVKIARGTTGRRCNLYEAKVWKNASPDRKRNLCPVVALLPGGIALVMERARPLSDEEGRERMRTGGFPKWDYDPRDPEDRGSPFEPKGSDWGRLRDGHLVALDYSTHVLAEPDEQEPRA
jgi:hypothetical protein